MNRIEKLTRTTLDKSIFIAIFLAIVSFLYLPLIQVPYVGIGAGFCAITAKTLKSIIRQPRPSSLKVRHGYGMPSSHSQNTAFFTCYFNLFQLRQTLTIGGFMISLLTNGFLLLILWSRVNFKHHTWEQVIVGLSVGTILGAGWFMLWVGYISSELRNIRFLVDYGFI
ncbi:hypothetical protein K7432_002540 [Basidiobolus ranarum]|uniref:Phosphatidic acid phosphatase type 2/haloperoxidase domain-containing protein n=1 Tax=Basidiobolus ranarum TaxID=34480 RepID=A0ABR2X1C1_9FUNG